MAPVKNLREAYGQALVALGKRNRHVVALEADLGKSTRSILFQGAFPDRYFEMGIAEQNMASTAAGLALAGKIPFMHSFAVFASGRAFDQLRNSVCIPGLSVRICGSSCGLSDFGDGKTHQALEDVAIMRVLPGMTVLCPADAIEVTKMVPCLLDWKGPVYLRINRNDLPFVTPDSEPYGITLQGSDVVWFTERAGNRVGRYQVSTDRLIEYALPTPGSQPTDIAVDGAGCAWYTASAADRLGRLCPSAMGATYLPLVLR